VIYAVFEAIVISLVLAWSLWFALRKFFPRAYRGALAQLASRLVQSSRASVHALGERLMPLQVESGGGCDSGGGCSTCGTCASTAPSPDNVTHPLIFHPRVKR